ncbi:50S ribosomal protein L17 [candidate division WWE3 bacterium RIFCSPLOWO2_01_FULL_42_11]|uniref:Large ribosomal subunit protein bL17 n=1 Tax=candidate division WWE3 bacterium RIFCSPLOWO2_01_FULL_42_11 TaxID=1802627 RepID=A0A1F4VRX0_UNCKA|nr:MAG: 50S ribosomal protein L17 [candidate division WWE3 bacterium RIFCSPLOWO2_01_FULL_42_11]
MQKHRIKSNNLGRDTAHHKSLLRNLGTSMVLNGSLETTLPKARALRPVIEKLVTRARIGDLNSRRAMHAFFFTDVAVDKMLTEVAPKFKERSGGYTRIVKLGPRKNDRAEVARIEFIDKVGQVEAPKVASRIGKTKATKVVKEEPVV